jgi:hypothetical protein
MQAADDVPCLSDLPLDVLHGLLLRFLSPRDVVALSAASKPLRQHAENEQVIWPAICQREFGACTQVEQWVAGSSSSSTPLSYRCVARWCWQLGDMACVSCPSGLNYLRIAIHFSTGKLCAMVNVHVQRVALGWHGQRSGCMGEDPMPTC